MGDVSQYCDEFTMNISQIFLDASQVQVLTSVSHSALTVQCTYVQHVLCPIDRNAFAHIELIQFRCIRKFIPFSMKIKKKKKRRHVDICRHGVDKTENCAHDR